MKKHNDGYVLPFVLVVLVVVCLVAVSLMSNSLSNLQRQQASIERMQAKYAAMGEIEKVKGATGKAICCSDVEGCVCTSGNCTCTSGDCTYSAENSNCDCLKCSAIKVLVSRLGAERLSYNQIKVTESVGKTTIAAVFEVEISEDSVCPSASTPCACEAENGTSSCSCTAVTASLKDYTSYTISTEEVTG